MHVQRTVEVLQRFRNEGFAELWNKVVKEYDIGLPVLPRVRKSQKRNDTDSSPHVFRSPEELYRKLFFEILDLALTSLSNRFASDTTKFLDDFESFIIKKTKSPE